MKEHLELGCTPSSEDCAQVGSPNYRERALLECRTFIHQLQRTFSISPDSTFLRIKSFPHDFGNYFEVCAYYDPTNTIETALAYHIESNTPEYWDAESKRELGIKEVSPCN